MDSTKTKIKRESKRRIKADFDRSALKDRLKAKFVNFYFFSNIVVKIFRFVFLLGIAYVVLFPKDHQCDVLGVGQVQLGQIGVIGIGAGAAGNLKNQGGAEVLSGLGDALDDLHVVDVESAHGVTASVGLLEHFLGRNDRHRNDLLVTCRRTYLYKIHYSTFFSP